jgi:hypothetical protein
MAPEIPPPPERDSQATWPNGEPQKIRDAYDDKSSQS